MQLVNTGPEPFFEDVANHMAAICATPIALVAIEGANRIWINRPDQERGAETAGCARSLIGLLGAQRTNVSDFACPQGAWPWGEAPRAYLTSPLILQGEFVGILAIADRQPRVWTQFDQDYMARASRLVAGHFEARAALTERDAALRDASTYKSAIEKFALVSVTDRNGAITYVNDQFCEISGYQREQLIGANHRIVNSGRHPKAFFVEMWRTIGAGAVWRGEICNRAKNGALYWVDSFVVPLFQDGADRPSGFMSIRYDRTEERRNQERLADALDALTDERARLEARVRERTKALQQAAQSARDANAAKSLFLGAMSHELRTPLNAIIGYAEMIAEDAEEDGRGEARRDAESIGVSARNLLTLINDILDFARIEAGSVALGGVQVAVGELADDVLTVMRAAAERNGNTLALDIEPDLPLVFTDPVRLRQCLLALVSNAVKFTQQGAVTIRARAETRADVDGVRLDVVDTGVGISAPALARIFQPFVQADQSVGRIFGGIGLGLSITKRIVDLMGGEVSAQSEEGRGAAFSIWTPLRVQRAHHVWEGELEEARA